MMQRLIGAMSINLLLLITALSYADTASAQIRAPWAIRPTPHLTASVYGRRSTARSPGGI